MREKYIAPDVYFEKFELSRSIAAGCSTVGIGAANLLHQNEQYFASASSMECAQNWSDVTPPFGFEGFCYWNGEFKLMTS